MSLDFNSNQKVDDDADTHPVAPIDRRKETAIPARAISS